jgi:MFS family permease
MGDGATYGVMVGVGETYLAAFALAIGLGEVSSGLISSVPLLAGGITQLISLRGVRWIGSEKRWILLGATIQGLAFIPLVIAALYGSISLGALLLIASVYWAGGLSTGPAWNTWMETIVPRRIRPRYFARRTRFSQLTTFGSFLLGGLALQWSKDHQMTLYGFACLFTIAGLFRFWSVLCLAQHQTPPAEDDDTKCSPASDAATSLKSTEMQHGGRLLAYLVVVQGFVQLSGPYFAPYMLEELHYSYTEFVGLIAIAFLSKIMTLPWWANIAKKHDAHTLLWIGGVGIAPLAAMWLVSREFWWLALTQFVCGIMWAAYELGFFLLFFDALPVAHRTRMLTLYNLANTASWCTGALIGGGLLYWLGADQRAYFVLFAVSSMGRFAALLLLARTGGPRSPVHAIRVRVLGIRPNSASIDSPILSGVSKSGVLGSIGNQDRKVA